MPSGSANSAEKVSPRQTDLSQSRGDTVAGIGLAQIDYLTGTLVFDSIAAALFGFPARVPIRRSAVHARFHPDDTAALEQSISAVLDPANGGFMSVEHRIVRPDASTCWVSARKQVDFAPASDGASRPVSGVLAVIDISAHRQTTAALRRNSSQRDTGGKRHDQRAVVGPRASI